MFVGAHPDDDAFAVARTVSLHATDPTLRLVLVHATDGEAGEIAPDSGVEPHELGVVRREETAESWRVVGHPPDRHEWFELADGRLADHPFDDLVARITAVMDEERPDVVVTFGPDGISGHPDHVVVGAATTQAFLGLAAAGGPGLQRLLHGAIRQSWVDRWNSKRRELGLWTWDPSEPFHLRGVPDETIGVEVDTTSVVERVIAAIRAHRTQWSYRTMDDDRALGESLRAEHFVIAWPPRAPGDPVLGDVFEGLDTSRIG